MKSIKTFITFTFLFTFAVCISAQDQTPKIVWKNLQEKYENFYDIEPQIINEGNVSIYYDSYYIPYIDFERFDEKSNSWMVSRVWQCGTGYRPAIKKVKPLEKIPFIFFKDSWDEITTEDSTSMPKFKKSPEYNGTGRYRFKFRFGIKKSNVQHLLTYSPEFEVIEKDFKK